MRRANAVVALAIAAPATACSGHGHHHAVDPPLLVPWSRVGDIRLGEARARVEREYGRVSHGYHVVQRYGDTGEGYYRLHGSRVAVTFYGRRVGEIGFATRYYRTRSGFGVGSRIPLGPCHRTATSRCEHRWRGFVYNPTLREQPCSCWVKVGRGRRGRSIDSRNFGKPWFFIYLDRGRVAGFFFSLRYID